MALVAILDANVLWPQYLRDVLIRAAVADLYRAAWTDRILDEMQQSLIRRGQVHEAQINRTVYLMREKCAHFMVEGYENLVPAMTNDEKDRHVLAAAIRVGADTIVTDNTRDFPLISRELYGIDLHTPDEFLEELWITDANRMSRVLVDMAAGLNKPPLTPQDLVQLLGKNHAPRFAEIVLSSDALDSALQAAQERIPPPHYRLL